MIESSSQLDNFTISAFNSAEIEEFASKLNEETDNLSTLTKPIWRSNKPKKAFNGYNYEGRVFTLDEIDTFLQTAFNKAPLKRSTSRVLYYN